MSSANDAVFQRRNKQIQDAIYGQNLKQALQLIEKRMKKGENTRFLKAWRAHVLYRHADQTHHQRGITETLELCKLDPPTTDLETLEILNQTLETLDGHGGMARDLWEKAAKAKPLELEIQTRWFTYAFEDGDWKSAQKAAMSLQHNFPKTRKYYFWAIFLSYLVSVDVLNSDADRKLFGTLAYRMVSKAAESVPSDPKDLPSVPKAIQTTEELSLLVKIFESQERYGEAIKILDSQNLGLSSQIVQNDWHFVRMKLLDLEKAGFWFEGLEFARSLLNSPHGNAEKGTLRERDDWAVWNLLIMSTKSINNQETSAETRKFVDNFIESQRDSRNAQLARLDLMLWMVQSGSLSTEDLVSALRVYFDCNKHKLYLFVDVQRYLSELDKDGRDQFFAKLPSSFEGETNGSGSSNNSTSVPLINALKLEYCFKLSPDDKDVSSQSVEDFLSRCLRTYRNIARPQRTSASTTIESQPSDDLCLLAAMSLIRWAWSRAGSDWNQIPDTVLIQAASILDRLISDSPHNYQALLLLLRIYLRLGAGSLALKTFSKLSVKHLQNETVAHVLYTRFATIHPNSALPIEGAEPKDFDPQSALMQALTFYRNANITTLKNGTAGLDLGSYLNVEGNIELQGRLNRSICQKMYILEVRRMQRLASGRPMGRYDELARDTSPLMDNRKFDAFMNCEALGKTTIEEMIRLGPLPRDDWVRAMQITDQLFMIWKNLAAQKPAPPEVKIPPIDSLLKANIRSQLTAIEAENTEIHVKLLTVASSLSGSQLITTVEVDECLLQVETWLKSKLNDFTPTEKRLTEMVAGLAISLSSKQNQHFVPSWRYFHATFSVLETVKAISLATTVLSNKTSKATKVSKDKTDRLTSLTRELYEKIRETARILKSQISESGMLNTLIDNVLLGVESDPSRRQLHAELAATLDSSALEIFCGTLMESWEEALDGVLAVTL